MEIQIARYESYFPSDPHDKKETKKEFMKDTRFAKSKEVMLFSMTPIKVFNQQTKPNHNQKLKKKFRENKPKK